MLYLGFLPLLLLRLFWRGRSNPAYRHRWQERFGYYARGSFGLRPIWIHAVSVGEVAAAVPLVKGLRERYPDYPVLFTTTTPTGCDAVTRQFGQSVSHAYFPYDLAFIVRRFLAHFQPRLLLLMETELWPNVIEGCQQAGVAVLLVNGRLSAGSARRYRWIQPLMRQMLEALTHAAMQSQADADRLCDLGARPARVSVTGSLKFDIQIAPSVYEEAAALRRRLGVNRPIWMAASTRPGEEGLLLEAAAQVRARFPSLLLILSPRHPERFVEVLDLCTRAGLKVQRRSADLRCEADTTVFLLDSMGELTRFYATCDIAFVGGSLVPLGGHNVLEPAALGIPIVVGPHMFNFLEITHKLAAGGALQSAPDVAGVSAIVNAWFADSDARDDTGRRGRLIVEANRGATHRILTRVDDALR